MRWLPYCTYVPLEFLTANLSYSIYVCNIEQSWSLKYRRFRVFFFLFKGFHWSFAALLFIIPWHFERLIFILFVCVFLFCLFVYSSQVQYWGIVSLALLWEDDFDQHLIGYMVHMSFFNLLFQLLIQFYVGMELDFLTLCRRKKWNWS